MKHLTQLATYTAFALALFVSHLNAAVAGGPDDCPVGLVSGLTLDDEFGSGTSELTRCLEKRSRAKVVFQINKACRNDACTAPYAIGNIINAINDYEITHDMIIGEDVEIAAIVHSGGYSLILNNDSDHPHADTNLFQAGMEELIRKGVDVYFCQNTARSRGVITEQLIPGVKYVTAGVTAIADFQMLGYGYVQP